MAFLIPENIPSRSDVNERLQLVARAFRDVLPDDVTVWLEEDDVQFLVVLDPAVGLIVVEAPPEKTLGAGPRKRVPKPAERHTQSARSSLSRRRGELDKRVSSELRIESLPTGIALALPAARRSMIEKSSLLDLGLPILSAEDFESGVLRDSFRRILGGSDVALTELQERVARGIVNPEIIIGGASQDGQAQLVFSPPSVAPDEVIRVLDREQERLARHLGSGYRLIRGVAGSGKTLILTHRARFLAEFFPNLRTLLVCYNKALSLALQSELADVASVDVKTIDSVARSVVGGGGGRLDDEGFRRQREQAAVIAANGSQAQRYDLVLVDEAQDFDSAGLDLAYALLKPDRDDFIMALDSAQNIYRRRMSWNPSGITARGRTTVLRTNYRNTREILEFAMNFLVGSTIWVPPDLERDPDAVVPPEAASRSGPEPRVLTCRDRDDEAAIAAREVKRLYAEGIDPDSIAVFYGSKAMQKQLYFAFRDADLPYFHVQQNWKSRGQVISMQDVVRSSTLQGLKGLEFSRVVIAGANDVWLPDDSDDEAVRRLLYVGMTRAMDELVVTVSGQGPTVSALHAA